MEFHGVISHGLQARTSRVRFVKSSQIVAENGRQKSKGHPELCQTLRHPALWPAAGVFCSPGEFSLQLSGLIKQNIPTGLENDSNQFCSPPTKHSNWLMLAGTEDRLFFSHES